MGAVIDEEAFATHLAYIEHAKVRRTRRSCGGECDDSKGWFIQPTVIETDDPNFERCARDLRPGADLFVYPDDKLDETLRRCATASAYALTGAIFAQDRAAIEASTGCARRRQLLRQRQADRRRRRPAAVRRRARVGHQRQGRLAS
jgi:acyl-CoA reductase-like NAD-dependent aldehyde dehydrogenase